MRDEDEELGLMEGVSFRRRRKKTKRRRRKFLFIVIQFFTNRAAMLDSEGRLKVFFLPGDFFKS